MYSVTNTSPAKEASLLFLTPYLTPLAVLVLYRSVQFVAERRLKRARTAMSNEENVHRTPQHKARVRARMRASAATAQSRQRRALRRPLPPPRSTLASRYASREHEGVRRAEERARMMAEAQLTPQEVLTVKRFSDFDSFVAAVNATVVLRKP